MKNWVQVLWIVAAAGSLSSCSDGPSSAKSVGGCLARAEAWGVVGKPVSDGCPSGAEVDAVVTSPRDLDIPGDRFLDAPATYNVIDDACCYQTLHYSE